MFPVVIGFDDTSLVQQLVNHLVEKGIAEVTGSSVEVFSDEDGGRVGVMSVIPPASSNPNWDRPKTAGKELFIKLIPPSPERS